MAGGSKGRVSIQLVSLASREVNTAILTTKGLWDMGFHSIGFPSE